MPKSLTKRFINMAALDQGQRLLAELGSGADPRDFHIEGDLLPLRCAMYGSIECILSMMRARTDLAEVLASMVDSNGERVIDWAAGCADAVQARALAELAPISSASPSANGHWPLARALSCGRWDAASFWLEFSPASAQLVSSWKRGTLHLAAEPGWELQRSEGMPAWTPPPAALVVRLIELGADPAALNEKDHSVLSRAIVAGNEAVFNACLAALPEDSMLLAFAGAKDSFGAVIEAVWHSRVDMLDSLVARGASIDEVSSKGFDAMHIAIRRDSRQVAESLVRHGWRFDAAVGLSTTSACSAMASTDPEGWLSWLKSCGCNLDARDDFGAHWAELAWERLPFERARVLWEALGTGTPPRALNSMLGPLERAARSKIEPNAKLAWLLSHGFSPARLDLAAALALGKTDAHEQLERCKSNSFRVLSFGTPRLIELGPMWSTEPDLSCIPSPPKHLASKTSSAVNPFSDFDFDDEPAFLSARLRPSLLAYAARHASSEVVSWLVEWDKAFGHWTDADRLCAWREAVSADASLPTLRILKTLMDTHGLKLWGPEESSFAIDRLGPAKARELGAPVHSCGATILAHLKARPHEAHSILLCDDSLFSGTQFHAPKKDRLEAKLALMVPWNIAAGSTHAGAIKALLPVGTPVPGLACAYAAMACAQSDQGDLVAWVVSHAKKLAQSADPLSPWGRDPACALALWDEQISYESKMHWQLTFAAADDVMQAVMIQRALLPVAGLPDGSISSPILCALIGNGSFNQARILIEHGIPAPSDFKGISKSLRQAAISSTGIGQGNEMLEDLRALVEALCARPDFCRILNLTDGAPILASVPDPALFETLLAAGASPGAGPNNAFVQLCENFPGRLTPGFAERLAQGSRDIYPENPLAVAAALAAMKPADSHKLSSFGPTAAARARLVRASRGVDALAWFVAFESDRCPVSRALGAGSAELALDLAEQAPSDYASRAGASWPALWMSKRLKLLGLALADSGKAGDAALTLLLSELARLSRLGVGLGCNTPAESSAFNLALPGTLEPARCLLWLINQGWRPESLIDHGHWGYELSRRLVDALGDTSEVQVPLVCLALAAERNSKSSIELALAWSKLALPAHIINSTGIIAPVHAALSPNDAALLEACLIETNLVVSTEAMPSLRPASRPRL